MIGKQQFSLGYLILEISLIGAAIGLIRSTVLTWHVMWPRPWMFTIPAAIVVVPAAIGGLFGQIKRGASVGLAGAALYVLQTLVCGFPSDYDHSATSDALGLIGFVALGMGLMAFFMVTVRSDSLPREAGEQAIGWALAIVALVILVCVFLPPVY